MKKSKNFRQGLPFRRNTYIECFSLLHKNRSKFFMNPNDTTILSAAEKINYFALIRAYKVISHYKKVDPESMDANLRNRFEAWRNDEKNIREKDIAEMVVTEEMMYAFFFRDDIEKMLGFSLDPGED